MQKNILICDDDPYMLSLYRMILEKNDYKVISCERAERIFIYLADLKPDIIILDLSMIGIGGENALLMLKEDLKYNTIPVVLSSANADIEKIAERSGADGYLKKPFHVDQLLSVLESYLSVE